MGAGASVEGLPQDKMDRFKEKILALDTLNENQKSRLLETMNYELKKLQPPKSDKDLAAEKIQRIGRGKVARSQNDAGPAGETTEEVFINFCKAYRQTMMTNTIWAKFCKDARLLDKDKFPKPAVDMVWTTVARTEKKVTYTGFVELLKGVAVKKGVEYSVIEAHVLENAKVSNSGTKGASRFHDDKSTYTGTHIGK